MDFPEDQRGTLLKVVSDRPTNEAIFALLIPLRLMLLEKFGGSDKIDFLVCSAAFEDGRFVIFFLPLSQLQKVDGIWTNTLTGQNQTEAGLEEPRIDYGKGV